MGSLAYWPRQVARSAMREKNVCSVMVGLGLGLILKSKMEL